MDNKPYDLIVVGTGVAASTVASRVRKAGWRVAIVDFRPFGGTCELRGCDPKKVLVSGAEVVSAVQRLRGYGISGDVGIDWPELMAFKRTFTDPVPQQRERSFAEQGIDAFHGHARFTGKNSISINGSAIEGSHFVLAVGAEPVKLRIPGEEHLMTSEGFLSLEQLPARIVFVGGGYIAAEFSNIVARAGEHATVLQRQGQILSNFDPDLVGWLRESFEAAGIDVRTDTVVEGVERTSNGFRVRVSSKGKADTVEGDLVVHAAGRAPDFDALDVAKAGISLKKGRLELNDFLQSVSNPAVYAAGDSAQKGPALTPIASYDGEVVAANLLEGNRRKATYVAIPSVCFSIPQIATVGLSEARARNEGRKFRKRCARASDWYTARRVRERTYGFKVLIEEETDRILGAHLVGSEVGETINLFALAIRHGIMAAELKAAVFSYPTAASDVAHML